MVSMPVRLAFARDSTSRTGGDLGEAWDVRTRGAWAFEPGKLIRVIDWVGKISQFWPHLALGFHVLASLPASAHALLHKRDTRSATLWIAFIWLMPAAGSLLYLVLGINRIRRQALKLGVRGAASRPIQQDLDGPEHGGTGHLKLLARVVSRVVSEPLTATNRVHPLVNGDEAFPAMLAAIESAQQSISLVTYIFDNDASGREFANALGRAAKRGVAVRVLIDAAGTRYSWPPITHCLSRLGVRAAKFLPASLLTPWRVATINLRNHRKILVVDGHTAFTGGMNIRHGNVLADYPASPVQDLHFSIQGPVVAQLQDAFANDWAFTTDEVLDGEAWFPSLKGHGTVVARVIADGPDADFEKARWTFLAALAEAQTSAQILTPYFLPDPALVTALNLAALRGVRVDILLPSKNNLPFVHWASRAMWWQLLERGCHIWLTPPPFDHSKLMVVDGHWVLLGSANWDARGLRLNFELNVECYAKDLASDLAVVIEKKLLRAHEVTLAEVDARMILGRLRDATARLFSPFL
jgi:cardiolipin synthase